MTEEEAKETIAWHHTNECPCEGATKKTGHYERDYGEAVAFLEGFAYAKKIYRIND